MSKGKDRTPIAGAPSRGRGPRAGSNPDDTNHLTPVWSIAAFDLVGPWGKTRISEEEDHLWGQLYTKLKDYETMTWKEILSNRDYNHFVEVGRLDKPARSRLEVLNLDDIESLFRFRLSGKSRVWGIREGRVFKILWWDPEHEVCPSTK